MDASREGSGIVAPVVPAPWHASSARRGSRIHRIPETRPRMQARHVILLSLSVLAAPPALAAQADTAASRPEVEDVVLQGVRALDPLLLRSVLATAESTCASPLYALFCAAGDWGWAEREAFLDTAAVRADEERLRQAYAAWGYPSATVRAEIDPLADGDVRVRFVVAEGEPLRVRNVVVRGLAGFPEGADADLPIHRGDVYALPRIQAAQRQIARRLAERGHAFVRVDAPPQPVAGNEADVVLEVVPGPIAVFGPTVFRAEPPLESDALRRRLPYRPGRRFAPARLERTAERLYGLPIVDSVDIRPGPVTWSDSVVETAIAVGAGKPAVYQVQGVISSSRCAGAEGYVSHRYAFGAPRVLTISAGAWNLLASELCGRDEEGGFEEPAYYVTTRWAEPVGRSSWIQLEGGFTRETATRAYARRGWQARIGYARELASGVTGTVAFAPERSDNEAGGPFFCALYGACAGEGAEPVAGSATLSPFELRVDWERPGARAALGPPPPGPAWLAEGGPRWVPSASLALSAADGATGSDHAFARAEAQASLTRQIGRRVQVGGRARLGALAGADEPLPPQLRLFGGGPRGVRGVPVNLLGPRILQLREGDACGEVPACEDVRLAPDDVFVRAAGGDLLAEGSVEARWWMTRAVQLAAFVDAGALRSRGGETGALAGTRTESVITPGIGILALSPLGPLRLDVAYNPSPARRYPVVVRNEATDEYRFAGFATYDPFAFDDPDGWTEFRRRIQFQISGGAPF